MIGRFGTPLSAAAVVLLAVGSVAWLALRPGGSSPAAAARVLTATDWVLTGYTGTTGPRPAALHGLRLRFKDGRISGDDGCNSFGGPVTISGGRLKLGALASTAIGCTQQAPLSRYLTGTVTWRLAGDRLVITKDGVGTLTYGPQRTGGSAHLVAGTWVLEGVETGSGTDRTFHPLADSALTVGDGRLNAQTRCGMFVATVDIAATTLTVRHRGFLSHSCPAVGRDRQKIEQLLTATLRRVLTGTVPWSVTGDVLTIGAAQGAVLQYRATDSGAVVAARLVSRTWFLVGINGSRAGSSALRVTRAVPTLKISPGGELFATVSDCVFYRGRVRVHESAFIITARVRGAYPCVSPAPGQQEAADELFGVIDPFLTGTVDWRIDGDSLTLSRRNKGAVLTYSHRNPMAVTPSN